MTSPTVHTPSSPLSWTAPVSSWLLVRCAKWTGRQIARPFRFLKRHFWKITLSITTLVTVAWQYENWHGRKMLAEQRALWIAEYGEIKVEDFITPPVADDENFFTAPIFEKWCPPQAPLSAGANEFDKARRRAEEAMPHCRFQRINCEGINNGPAYPITKKSSTGLEVLDLADWEKQLADSGKKRPEGTTEAAWLLSTLPKDPILDELITAAQRPKSAWPLSYAEKLSVAKALDDPTAMPIIAVSNLFELLTSISHRARLAARAGEGKLAYDLAQILWRIPEASSQGGALVEGLVGIAAADFAVNTTAECMAARCWSEDQLQALTTRLNAVNVETMIRIPLMRELFSMNIFGVEKLRAVIKTNVESEIKSGIKMIMLNLSRQLGASLWVHGPEGWLDANLAYSLKWGRAQLTPDIPGDDLIYLQKKMDESLGSVREERTLKYPDPRRILAAVAMPALNNVAGSAIACQTRQRQLLFAIALERFYLKENRYPQSANELVPAYCAELPGDPNRPGHALVYETQEPSERYRLISQNQKHTMALPKVPLR